MASGKRHFRRANQVLFVGAAVAFVLQPWPLAAATTIGLALGKYANPDVRDQEQIRNHAESQFNRSFGSILGFFWSMYWWPLAALIPHRNWKSHLPVAATAIAYAYLFVPPLLAIWYYWGTGDVTTWLTVLLFNPYSLRIFVGWAIQDFVHLAQDKFSFYWSGGRK